MNPQFCLLYLHKYLFQCLHIYQMVYLDSIQNQNPLCLEYILLVIAQSCIKENNVNITQYIAS